MNIVATAPIAPTIAAPPNATAPVFGNCLSLEPFALLEFVGLPVASLVFAPVLAFVLAVVEASPPASTVVSPFELAGASVVASPLASTVVEPFASAGASVVASADGAAVVSELDPVDSAVVSAFEPVVSAVVSEFEPVDSAVVSAVVSADFSAVVSVPDVSLEPVSPAANSIDNSVFEV